MSATATPDIEIRFLESVECPGQVCAQAFVNEIDQNLGMNAKLEQSPIRRFCEMQCSDWHKSKTTATADLEFKIKLQGFKKAKS